ncbi:hypothetical protein K458DRAFT_50987 [Lentithecium fluviatile CBS 122367]|uniref:Uncharacterized protein n=1 Tax=Lentithecium fluviatile CBS 122367 TaxID=1168545 RepID=A0A6G1IYE0_9PLEO|nr:hypothetical protein K458DRAFT_50987 [Lentithecium fluviatile CBS 122367]
MFSFPFSSLTTYSAFSAFSCPISSDVSQSISLTAVPCYSGTRSAHAHTWTCTAPDPYNVDDQNPDAPTRTTPRHSTTLKRTVNTPEDHVARRRLALPLVTSTSTAHEEENRDHDAGVTGCDLQFKLHSSHPSSPDARASV